MWSLNWESPTNNAQFRMGLSFDSPVTQATLHTVTMKISILIVHNIHRNELHGDRRILFGRLFILELKEFWIRNWFYFWFSGTFSWIIKSLKYLQWAKNWMAAFKLWLYLFENIPTNPLLILRWPSEFSNCPVTANKWHFITFL